jgi:hypothetical protein
LNSESLIKHRFKKFQFQMQNKKETMSSEGSIEIIEEKIGSSRAKDLCEQISSLNDRLWCFSIRGCSIDVL